MSGSHRELLINPLVYDFMSGEIRPLCDPDGRAHSLGRLVIAAFQKGDKIDNQRYSLNDFIYTPSWAAETAIQARVHTTEVREMGYEFRGIDLCYSDRNEIRLTITMPEIGTLNPSLILSNSGRTGIIDMKAGVHFERSRLSLAMEVQDFFDAA